MPAPYPTPEDLRSALRNALSSMDSAPSFGFLFLNFPIDDIPSKDTDAFFETAGSITLKDYHVTDATVAYGRYSQV